MGTPSRLAAVALLVAGAIAAASDLSASPSSACPVRIWDASSLTVDVPQNGHAPGLLPIVALIITATVGYLARRQWRGHSIRIPVGRPQLYGRDKNFALYGQNKATV